MGPAEGRSSRDSAAGVVSKLPALRRGDLWWADLGEPHGSEPGFRRPVLVIQDDGFNQSKLATVVVLALTSNSRYGQLPGNVSLAATVSGLDRDSIINVSQITTIDKSWLDSWVSRLPNEVMAEVEYGLALILGFETG